MLSPSGLGPERACLVKAVAFGGICVPSMPKPLPRVKFYRPFRPTITC